MRWFSMVAILAAMLLASCATPKPQPDGKPVEFGDVPAPSQPRVVLPQESEPETQTPPKPAKVEKKKPAKTPKPAIVTADEALRGKVSRYNASGRFVVLEFPIAHLPRVGQSLFVYRDGLKVGEVRVTGPQRDDRTVADLTAGEAQSGDEVREQ